MQPIEITRTRRRGPRRSDTPAMSLAAVIADNSALRARAAALETALDGLLAVVKPVDAQGNIITRHNIATAAVASLTIDRPLSASVVAKNPDQ